MKIKEIIDALEHFAPLPLQDSFDNAGLQTGLTGTEATGALLCLDVTEAVLDEAISQGINFIIAHHPLLFHSLKALTGRTEVERCVMKAIRNDIAIYASHTNLDNAKGGVNYKIAEIIGLTDVHILSPRENKPETGAGVIGRLKEPEEETEFLLRLKKLFNASCLMYNNRLQKREVRTIALCGGAGAFLIPQAIQAGADVFVTGEIKYHEFQGHANDILLASLGHFESEQYTVDLLESVIHNTFPQLLVRKTQINTNPIKYM